MSTAKIRCDYYELWAEKIGYKTYRRKTRCKAAATMTFQDNPRLYRAPHLVHRYCETHGASQRTNAGQVELLAVRAV